MTCGTLLQALSVTATVKSQPCSLLIFAPNQDEESSQTDNFLFIFDCMHRSLRPSYSSGHGFCCCCCCWWWCCCCCCCWASRPGRKLAKPIAAAAAAEEGEWPIPGSREAGMPKGRGGIIGMDAIRIRSISDSWSRLVLARRFWNQILTCVSVSFSSAENSARSEIERYCFSRYFFSRELSCWVVKGVRGFRFGLCFLRVQRMGPVGGRSVMSANK